MEKKCEDFKCDVCINKLEAKLIDHRSKNTICCDKTCFCWEVMAVIDARKKIVQDWHDNNMCAGCDECRGSFEDRNEKSNINSGN